MLIYSPRSSSVRPYASTSPLRKRPTGLIRQCPVAAYPKKQSPSPDRRTSSAGRGAILLREFRRRGTENISPNLMQYPELWAVAKDIIQELTFLARENCRAKSFFIGLKNQRFLCLAPAPTPNAT